jgi:hypothetical protein
MWICRVCETIYACTGSWIWVLVNDSGLEEVRMSDGIPKTPGGAENLTKEFNMAPRVINTRV